MAITITEQAAAQLRTLFQEHGKPEASLRVWLAGMGCSGPQYGMAIDEEGKQDGDTAFESNGLTINVDPQSLEMMDGSVVEYSDEAGGGFRIDNPNIEDVPGCGRGGCEGCGV
jgi:iron-sulfur cluster assembly protein